MIDTRGKYFGAGFRSRKRVVETRYSLATTRHFALPTREREATGRRGENTRSPGQTADAAPLPSPSPTPTHCNHYETPFRIRGLNANASLRWPSEFPPPY